MHEAQETRQGRFDPRRRSTPKMTVKMEHVLWKLAIVAAIFAGGCFIYVKLFGSGLLNAPGVIFVL
jgi:hypothetical protein